MKTLIELKCPSCGANLSIEQEREFAYCQYCGTRILINDNSKFVYRHIDDADIKRAETERLVQLKEIELEEKKHGGRKVLIVLWVASLVILFLGGIILKSFGISAGSYAILIGLIVGMWGIGWLFNNNKNDKRKTNTRSGITITSAVADAQGQNYEALVSILKGLGFSNITCIPMNDLNIFKKSRNGQVESIVIDGDDDINEGDVFSADSSITITYHSIK